MTRDHYKGSKKTRNAVLDDEGELLPLSIRKESGVTAIEFFKVNKDDAEKVETIYARATGSDALGDGTLSNPYRTFRRAARDLPSISHDTVWIVDITGIGTETYTERYNLPSYTSNFSDRLQYPQAAPVFKEFLTLSSLNILATPTEVDTVSITGTATNATTGMKAYTDSSKSWTPDEHKGRFITGANLFEIGVIYANSATEIFVAAESALTGPLSILEPSAELKFGPAVDSFFEGSFVIKSLGATLTLGGIKFSRNASSGFMRIENCSATQHYMCHFETGVSLKFAGFHTFDACNLEGWIQDGAGVQVRHSYVHDFSTFSMHGDGGQGLDTWHAVRFENIGPLGHGGNAESYSGFSYKNCSVSSGTGAGIDYNGGGAVKVINSEILDCGSHGISCTGPGVFNAANVDGTGNGGYGIYLTNGAQVKAGTASSITGTSGDYKVGVLTADTWANFTGGAGALLDITATSGTLARLFTS